MQFFRSLAVVLALAAPAAAQAEGRSIIVLDASGSMWGQIDGQTKLEIARSALADVLSGLPAETEIGLMAYGHRTRGDCSDIELVVPPGQGTAQAIIDAANAMKFQGKTPLTEAVRQAAGDLRSTEEKATVILITDGIETCEADPCALGAELEASGVDFTAHVVGFGLTADEGRAVACLAENTGGKYIQAGDAGQLVEALKTTVAEAPPAPEPAPVPEPAPAPAALEDNVDPVLYLLPGGPEPEERVLQDAVFEFFPLSADGTPTDDWTTIYGRSKGSLPPGKYLLRTTMHEAVTEQEVEIGPNTELSQPLVVMEAGVLDLKVLATEGGEPDSDGFFQVNGPDDVTDSGYGKSYRVYPAGEYALQVTLGAASASDTVVIEPGKVTVKTMVLGVGLAVVSGFYTDAMAMGDAGQYVEILSAEKDIDGNRESLAYNYGDGVQFDLPPGDYVALISLGAAKAEVPFTIASGQRNEVKVVLNAGVASFAIPQGGYVEILSAAKDIQGNRTGFGYGYGPEWQTTLPAGDYVAAMEVEGTKTETPFTVKAGERVELVLN